MSVGSRQHSNCLARLENRLKSSYLRLSANAGRQRGRFSFSPVVVATRSLPLGHGLSGRTQGPCRDAPRDGATFGGVALLIIATFNSPSGPHGTASRAVVIGVAVCAAAIAIGCLVVVRPSPRLSVAFGLTSAIAISALSLAQHAPLAGFLASTGFAVLGGYLAFFHTPRLLAVNIAIAIARRRSWRGAWPTAATPRWPSRPSASCWS